MENKVPFYFFSREKLHALDRKNGSPWKIVVLVNSFSEKIRHTNVDYGIKKWCLGEFYRKDGDMGLKKWCLGEFYDKDGVWSIFTAFSGSLFSTIHVNVSNYNILS